MVAIKKQHRWRICPLGKHRVREHIRHTKNAVTSVETYCRNNKSKKEILTSLEIEEIYGLNNHMVKTRPTPSNRVAENKFDDKIGLWTQFWNEIFQSSEPLDPNWVKALIFTESGFNEKSLNKSNKKNPAKGLMQITKSTHKIMTNSKGELKEICFDTDEEDQYNPNINIAMGTRWLFHKKHLLRSRIGRNPSWEEVLWEYKGIYDDHSKKAERIRKDLRLYYEKLSINN